MNDERERIEGMLSEGRISADEAEQLLAAVEKADTRQEEEIKKPRLSRLALAGALGLPAAVVVWLLLFGFAMIWAEGPYVEDRASAGATLVALAVMLTGLGLSIAGLVAVRRAPDELRGQKLALFGIWLPAGLLAITAAAGTVTYFLVLPSTEERVRRAQAEDEQLQSVAKEEAREATRPVRPTIRLGLADRMGLSFEDIDRLVTAMEGAESLPTFYVHARGRTRRLDRWLSGRCFSRADAEKLEVRFSKDFPVRAATAWVGEDKRSFTPAAEDHLELELTPAIRKAWRERGALLVEIDAGKRLFPFELVVPPETLEIDGCAGFTVVQRRAKGLPGSRGYLQVRLGDITAGQVLVSIRTAEGETVVDTTSVRRGEEIPFTFGGEKYVLRVVELVNLLVGDDFGTLMVLTEGDAPEWRKIERLLALVERSDLTFIRNDKECAPAEAAAHLRSKLRVAKTKVEIHTVEDFIDKVASRSFTTGRPYSIKLPDGKTVEARAWLHEQAAELEAPRDE